MSERLEIISIATTIEEALATPSSINPYPQQAIGGIAVTEFGRMPSMGANWHVHTRYAETDNTYRTIWPINYPETGTDAKLDTADAPDDKRWTSYESKDFVPFKQTWEKECPTIAERYLRQQGAEATHNSYAAYVEGNDAAFLHATEFYGFVGRTANRLIKQGEPAGAYTLIQNAYRGIVYLDKERVDTSRLLEWSKNAVFSSLIEPGIGRALDEDHQSRNLSSQDYFGIANAQTYAAKHVGDIMRIHLASQALQAAGELYGSENSAVAEKLTHLRIKEQTALVWNANRLAKYLDGTPHQARTANAIAISEYSPVQVAEHLVAELQALDEQA